MSISLPGSDNPVSGKTWSALSTALLVGGITAALQDFIPAWHSAIPSAAQPFVVAAASAISAAVGAYLAHHHVTTNELSRAMADHQTRRILFDPMPVTLQPHASVAEVAEHVAPLPPPSNTSSGLSGPMPVDESDPFRSDDQPPK